MALEPGARLGPYQIERLLGSGGFGSVYRAHDSRLDRWVAIKALSEGIAGDPDRLGGFKEEARAAASLNHPHICSVYEVEHDSGVDYIVMELVDGRPLAQLTSPGGLPIHTAVRYATQIAAAMEHAHARGVVHGDVKAGNVMVTPTGDTKLVDFGLARRVRPLNQLTITQSATALPGGGIAGTPAYMAPEVIRGEKADQRSDIWALGILLHEMVAGSPPFHGRTMPEMISSILRDAPSAPSSGVPPALSAVIRRCLAKEPADRYQAAGEVRSALETVAAGEAWGEERRPQAEVTAGKRLRHGRAIAAAVGAAVAVGSAAYVWIHRTGDAGTPTSLAVLPCRTLAEVDRVEFLEVGIADSIIIALSNASQLRVRSTSAILQYEGQNIDPHEVGRALNAEYLLTCMLQPTAQTVAASVQLIHTSDGSATWGDRFEVARDQLPVLRDTISERVAAALRVRMTTGERERFYRRYTKNSAAYERYLQGRSALPRYTPEATLAAIDHFKQALAIDPQYPLAHAGLASAAARMRIRFSTGQDRTRWLDLAEREAGEAMRLDPDLAEAHEARAAVARQGEFDWNLTMAESDRALALNPSLAQPHFFRAGVFYHFGLFDLADRESQLGTLNDPTARVDGLRVLGNSALYDGRFAEAESRLNEARRLSGSASSGPNEALALFYLGRSPEAEGILESMSADPRAKAALASILAARGERTRAMTMTREIQSDTGLDHHVYYSLGATFAQLGNAAEAIRWLERAAASGFSCGTWFAKDPLLAPVRDEGGYRKIQADIERRVAEFRATYGRT